MKGSQVWKLTLDVALRVGGSGVDTILTSSRSNWIELNQIKSNAVQGQAGVFPHRGMGPGRLLPPSSQDKTPRHLIPPSIPVKQDSCPGH